MRILIKKRREILIKEIEEARITKDGNIGFPKLKKQYLTGERTEELFKNLLVNGYADLSEFGCEDYILNVLI